MMFLGFYILLWEEYRFGVFSTGYWIQLKSTDVDNYFYFEMELQSLHCVISLTKYCTIFDYKTMDTKYSILGWTSTFGYILTVNYFKDWQIRSNTSIFDLSYELKISLSSQIANLLNIFGTWGNIKIFSNVSWDI